MISFNTKNFFALHKKVAETFIVIRNAEKQCSQIDT